MKQYLSDEQQKKLYEKRHAAAWVNLKKDFDLWERLRKIERARANKESRKDISN